MSCTLESFWQKKKKIVCPLPPSSLPLSPHLFLLLLVSFVYFTNLIFFSILYNLYQPKTIIKGKLFFCVKSINSRFFSVGEIPSKLPNPQLPDLIRVNAEDCIIIGLLSFVMVTTLGRHFSSTEDTPASDPHWSWALFSGV